MGGRKKAAKKGKSGGGGGGGGGQKSAAKDASQSQAPPAPADCAAVNGAAPGNALPPQGFVAFSGGPTIVLRCPSHKYDSTVAFYRDILGLRVEQRGGQREALACSFEWSNSMNLIVVRTDKLTHPTVWLTVDTTNVTDAQTILEQRAVLRKDVPEQLPEGVHGFWASPPSDMMHIVKAEGDSMACYPVAANTSKPSVCAANGGGSAAGREAPEGDEEEEGGANPLNVSAASHAPQGQKGKIASCSFSGGNNIAIKCPPTKYESTVAFYREVLGLEVLHYCRTCCKIRWYNGMSLWIDCVEAISSAAVWLEVTTSNTHTARAYLKGRKRVSIRPEVEALPPGVDGFWISPPNDMVHLIRGPDGQDEIGLPPGELSSTPFETAAQSYLREQGGAEPGTAEAPPAVAENGIVSEDAE